MDKRLEFEEAAFKLKEQIAALEKMQFPADQQAKKDQALKMAKSLVAAGKHADATKVLDALAAKATAPKSPTQPLPTDTQKPQAPPRPVTVAPLPTPAQVKKAKRGAKVDNLNKNLQALGAAAAAAVPRAPWIMVLTAAGRLWSSNVESLFEPSVR